MQVGLDATFAVKRIKEHLQQHGHTGWVRYLFPNQQHTYAQVWGTARAAGERSMGRGMYLCVPPQRAPDMLSHQKLR